MKIAFVTLGKFKSTECRALVDEYLKRLGRYFPTQHHVLNYSEEKPGSRISSQDEALMKFLAGRSGNRTLVIMDERGKMLKSSDFAIQLERWKDGSVGELIIAVGGAHGYGEALRRQAGFLWSLSPATFPHELAAAMATEQLYRAATILAKHPYHNE